MCPTDISTELLDMSTVLVRNIYDVCQCIPDGQYHGIDVPSTHPFVIHCVSFGAPSGDILCLGMKSVRMLELAFSNKNINGGHHYKNTAIYPCQNDLFLMYSRDRNIICIMHP
jgi:hypothetical protein